MWEESENSSVCTRESLSPPSWLDPQTGALVKEIIDRFIVHHPDVLAVVLYGSVARHEERPLSEPDPSDVDLLIVLDSDDPFVSVHRGAALQQTLGEAEARHLHAPREVQVQFASRTLSEWDPLFVTNVKRDGMILYQRGTLHALLSAWPHQTAS
jgi:predicted nucleotidyltransferase